MDVTFGHGSEETTEKTNYGQARFYSHLRGRGLDNGAVAQVLRLLHPRLEHGLVNHLELVQGDKRVFDDNLKKDKKLERV